MRSIRNLSLLFLILFSLRGLAQTDSIAYYEKRLEDSHSEKENISIYVRLSRLYIASTNAKAARLYAEKVIELAGKRNDSLSLGEAFSQMATLFTSKGQNDSSLLSLDRAERYCRQYPEKLPMLYLQRGEVFYSNHDFAHALTFFIQAGKGASTFHQNRLSLMAHLDIGNVYYEMANTEPQKMDSAISYYQKCFLIKMPEKDSALYEMIHNNLGNCYVTMKNNKKGKEELLQALRLAEKFNMIDALPIINYNLAGVESDMNQFMEAKEHLLQSMKLGDLIRDKRNLTYCLQLISKVDSGLGLKMQAFSDQYAYISLSDSLYNTDMFKRMAEMQTRYDLGKKDNEIRLLNKDKDLASEKLKQERIVTLLIGIALILFCLISIVLYRNYRIKIKANRILELQKTDIEHKRRLLSEKNQQIEDSLQYARKIQEAVLPSVLFSDAAVQDQFVYFQPKNIVSGDFYWSHRINDYLFFAVVDCTHSGVPGAMMSMFGYDMLEHIVSDKGLTEPAQILQELNMLVITKLSNKSVVNKDGMDLTLCRFNFKTKELVYSGAKNKLLLVSKTESHLLEVDDVSIGESMETFFSQETRLLLEGDILYLFTNGYYDQAGKDNGLKFTAMKFQNMLAEISPFKCDIQAYKLAMVFEDWKNDLPQQDDVLVIGVKFS